MRSTSRAVDEPALPLGVPDRVTDRPRRSRRKGGAATEFVHRLGSDALVSHGLPAGTQVVVDTQRPPRRGHILFVRVRGRLKVGVFDVELGRAVLRSDLESFWLDHTTEVWGVVTAADPPIDGLVLS
jgi:hypothetical protein